jgi:hypothetical protein
MTTTTFNILLAAKTARMRAGVTSIAGPPAMAGTRGTSGFGASASGVDQDHNYDALAARGAG